jgi:predicted outer membrane repeat protein
MIPLLALAALLATFAALPAQHAHAASTTYYVRDGASGSGCTSWADACDSLQDALGKATSGDEIWVAAGVYYPDEGSGQSDNNRGSTFQLKEGVDIYGGFAGNEANRDDRDWENNVTVLSGDIDGDDTNDDGNNIAETWNDIQGSNAYHVVKGANNATLDGVTITAGKADGSDPDDGGGGMYNDGSNPTLTNVTFSGNQAAQHGGGMFNWDGSSPTLTNVTFAGNQAEYYGGGMHNWDGSSPTLTNVTFAGNQADYGGGGMYNYISSSPTLTNVTFSGNQANGYGGGMFNDSISPTLTNVTFEGNQAAQHGGGMYNYSGSPTLTNVTFSGNQAAQHGGGMYNDSSSPTLQNSILWGNAAGTSGDQVYNDSSTPTYNYSLVQDEDLTGQGTGNLDGTSAANDPLFIKPVAASNAPTTDGDYRLGGGSSAIGKGNNSLLPADTSDLDGDGDTSEQLPLDLGVNPRIMGSTVDLGAYEFQGEEEEKSTVYLPMITR